MLGLTVSCFSSSGSSLTHTNPDNLPGDGLTPLSLSSSYVDRELVRVLKALIRLLRARGPDLEAINALI